MFLPKEVEVDALKGLVRSNKFSTLHLNLRVPDVSFQTNGKNLLIDVRVNHGIKTSLELWTGVISHISLQEGLQKRSLARSILVTLARMGKRYDAVKDVMKGLCRLFVILSYFSLIFLFFLKKKIETFFLLILF